MLNEKLCTKCGEVKPSDGFRPRPEVKSGLASWCRTCTYKQVNKVNNPAKRKFQKEHIIEMLGGKCMKCNQVFPYYVFDLHHRNPAEKEFAMTDLHDKAWARIIKEVAKCDLLCSNCHRIEHHSQRDDLKPVAMRETGRPQ